MSISTYCIIIILMKRKVVILLWLTQVARGSNTFWTFSWLKAPTSTSTFKDGRLWFLRQRSNFTSTCVIGIVLEGSLQAILHTRGCRGDGCWYCSSAAEQPSAGCDTFQRMLRRCLAMVMIVRHPSIPPSLYTVMGRYSGPRHAEVISDRQAAALILLIVADGCQYCPQCPALLVSR